MSKLGAVADWRENLRRSNRFFRRISFMRGLLVIMVGIWGRYEGKISLPVTAVIVGAGLWIIWAHVFREKD
jgi:hypothetical protein